MNVKSVVKTENGFVKFEGELSQQEADYVIGLGLNLLMQQGALGNVQEALSDDAPTEGDTLQ